MCERKLISEPKESLLSRIQQLAANGQGEPSIPTAQLPTGFSMVAKAAFGAKTTAQ